MRTFNFTRSDLEFFERAKEQGFTYTEACKQFGWNHQTVRKYAHRNGFGAELRLIYPPSWSMPFPSRDSWKQKTNSLHYRAATMAWRKCA